MIDTINQIFDNRYEELKQYTLQVNSKYVWDYKKQTNTSKVFLVSDDPGNIPIGESVTVEELKKFIINSYVPIKTLKLFCEQSREVATCYTIDKDNKYVNLSTNE